VNHVPRLAPFAGVLGLVALWSIAIHLSRVQLLPGPLEVIGAIVELARKGILFKYLIASLFRVTWGYFAALVAIPFGLTLGWYARGRKAVAPVLQILRPISPLAWIPIAILWFGVGDLPAVFIIFVASFLSLAFSAMNAVDKVSAVHINAGRNFGLSTRGLVRKILLPAVAPEIIIAMRLTLGIAWLVVVAAEMLAVNSGLGFLIIDARNAGNRYDLVVAGMVLIGTVGFLLDVLMRRLERVPSVRWGYVDRAAHGPEVDS
jgi:NitT/TauT family transport system permease protein